MTAQPRALYLTYVAVVLATAGLAVLTLAGSHLGTTDSSSALYIGLLLVAVGAMSVRAITSRELSFAWFAFALAVAARAGGELFFGISLSDAASSDASVVGDAFGLAFYPFAALGLVLLARKTVSRVPAGATMDALIGALAISAFIAAGIVQGVLDQIEEGSSRQLVELAYPVADVVLLCVVISVLGALRWRPSRAWALIAASLGIVALADAIALSQSPLATYRHGTLLDLLWPVAMLTIAYAAWQPLRESEPEPDDSIARDLPVVPVIAGLVAVALVGSGSIGTLNTSATILSVSALVFTIVRLVSLFAENTKLLDLKRLESETDVLTGLNNRRRLLLDLEDALAVATPQRPWLFAMFDLDGFKKYNDTFGHPAGDRLLAHLAGKLRRELEGSEATAYRLGGDEFCVLGEIPSGSVDALLERSVSALSESGGGFSIGCSFGSTMLPGEAGNEADVLGLADGRLYDEKFRKQTLREQAHEPLLQALFEREPELEKHIASVTEMALLVGAHFHLDAEEQSDLGLVAKLHDIGKLAVPDVILQKPHALTGDEATFVRDHAVIGERILASAPTLSRLAPIVRATHERWDGKGYPDGLTGEQIPRLARIVSACDAVDAMLSERPYSPRMTIEEATAELRRCSGTQFDPQVALAIIAIIGEKLEDAETQALGSGLRISA